MMTNFNKSVSIYFSTELKLFWVKNVFMNDREDTN